MHNKDSIAVEDDSGNLVTYERLQYRVETISQALRTAGVKHGSRVAVFQHPSADWVSSLLAIWHVGGIYIPLDLKIPLPHLAFIAALAKPTVILCKDGTENDVHRLKYASSVVNVEHLQDVMIATQSQARSNTAAAILITSGTTGPPKAVILHHSAVRNTIEGLTKQYDIGAEKVLQQSAYTFDFSLEQILCGLVNAGSVYVASKESRLDPRAISTIIASKDITYTRATPSEYASWITYGSEQLSRAPRWKFAWAGGELLSLSLRKSMGSLGLKDLALYNSYGPVETITCTKTKVPLITSPEHENQPIPLGSPLPNYLVYIVDTELEIVPQGVKGEILIGGPSVANGYLNNVKLGSEHFISNPWDSGILYRTGDTGYFRYDGALMFYGRVTGDTQIKIRGMRIDLQDIEACIMKGAAGALHRAIVTVRDHDRLVAHVQFATADYANENQQRAFFQHLRSTLPLPVHMLPALFLPIAHMPVTAHGKIDRAAVRLLPLPQSANGVRTGETLNDIERKLVDVWKEVVPRDTVDSVQITTHTSFFELGGNSLLLVKLQHVVNQRFGVKLSLLDLLGASTLGSLADIVETGSSNGLSDHEPGEETSVA